MASGDVLKVSALHYKDPSNTDEDFEKHVTEKINPAWVKLVQRHEVIKYSIVSGSPLALTVDPEYQEIGRDSEAGWIDSPRGEIMVGYERVHIDNKEIVEETAKEWAGWLCLGCSQRFTGVF